MRKYQIIVEDRKKGSEGQWATTTYRVQTELPLEGEEQAVIYWLEEYKNREVFAIKSIMEIDDKDWETIYAPPQA